MAKEFISRNDVKETKDFNPTLAPSALSDALKKKKKQPKICRGNG
jgi:hypothetical protein